MIKKLFIIACVALITVGGIFAYILYKRPLQSVSVASTPIVTDCSVTDTGVFDAVNKYRVEVGVAPLVFNPVLDDFSNQRVIDQNGILDAHSGLQPLSEKARMGLYTIIGEDQQFWAGCHNSDARVLGFKQSDRHWKSLMNPRYDEIGVGYFDNVLNINLGDVQ